MAKTRLSILGVFGETEYTVRECRQMHEQSTNYAATPCASSQPNTRGYKPLISRHILNCSAFDFRFAKRPHISHPYGS